MSLLNFHWNVFSDHDKLPHDFFALPMSSSSSVWEERWKIWIFSRNGVPLRVGCSCLMSHTLSISLIPFYTLTHSYRLTIFPPLSLAHTLTLPKEIFVTRNTKKHFRISLSICQCKTIAITITKAITIAKISQWKERMI